MTRSEARALAGAPRSTPLLSAQLVLVDSGALQARDGLRSHCTSLRAALKNLRASMEECRPPRLNAVVGGTV